MNGDYEVIRTALFSIPAQDRDTWLRMGMAVKSELGEDGFPLWDTWSQTADNYNVKDAKAVWRSIKVNGGVSIGSLFHKAKRYGWRLSHPFQGPSPEEFERRRTQGEAEERKRQAEEASRHARARKRAQSIWESAGLASDDHPYLVRKEAKAHGLKLYRGDLVIDGMPCDGALLVPIHDTEGVLHSLEFISPEAEKRFLPGGKKTGCLFLIGTPGAVLCIAEGYATGATVHQAAGYAVAVAFNAGNLKPVAIGLRKRFPGAKIILCADNDRFTPGNPGVTKAIEAARAVKGYLVVPRFDDLGPYDYYAGGDAYG